LLFSPRPSLQVSEENILAKQIQSALKQHVELSANDHKALKSRSKRLKALVDANPLLQVSTSDRKRKIDALTSHLQPGLNVTIDIGGGGPENKKSRKSLVLANVLRVQPGNRSRVYGRGGSVKLPARNQLGEGQDYISFLELTFPATIPSLYIGGNRTMGHTCELMTGECVELASLPTATDKASINADLMLHAVASTAGDDGADAHSNFVLMVDLPLVTVEEAVAILCTAKLTDQSPGINVDEMAVNAFLSQAHEPLTAKMHPKTASIDKQFVALPTINPLVKRELYSAMLHISYNCSIGGNRGGLIFRKTLTPALLKDLIASCTEVDVKECLSRFESLVETHSANLHFQLTLPGEQGPLLGFHADASNGCVRSVFSNQGPANWMPKGGWDGFFDDPTLRLPVHMQRIVQANIQQTSAMSTLTSIVTAACPAPPAYAAIVAVQDLFHAVDVDLKEAGKRMMSEAPMAGAMLDAGKKLRETVAMPTANNATTDFTGSLVVVLSDLKKVMLAKARDLLGKCEEPNCTKFAVTNGSTGKCAEHGGGKLCSADQCMKMAVTTGGTGKCTEHGGGKLCSADQCTKMAVHNGSTDKCTDHGGRKICAASGCNASVYVEGVCKKNACKINKAKKPTAGSKKETKKMPD
jgi:hypothetical protein